MFRDSFRV